MFLFSAASSARSVPVYLCTSVLMALAVANSMYPVPLLARPSCLARVDQEALEQGSTPHSNNNPAVRSGVSRPQPLLPSPHSFVACLPLSLSTVQSIFQLRSTLVRAFQSCRLHTPCSSPCLHARWLHFLDSPPNSIAPGRRCRYDLICLPAHHLRNVANANSHSPACLPPICLRARNKLPGGENLTTIPTPVLRTSRAAAALPPGTAHGFHQMLTVRVAPPMPLAQDAPASTAPRTRLGIATANTEGGAPRTTTPQAATHPRSLAVQTHMLAQCIHPPISQETESQ